MLGQTKRNKQGIEIGNQVKSTTTCSHHQETLAHKSPQHGASIHPVRSSKARALHAHNERLIENHVWRCRRSYGEWPKRIKFRTIFAMRTYVLRGLQLDVRGKYRCEIMARDTFSINSYAKWLDFGELRLFYLFCCCCCCCCCLNTHEI